MEVMQKDVYSMNHKRRLRDSVDFAKFMRRTLECLLSHNASFTDMKPKNVAVKNCAPKDSFRLIDLDGINGTVSSMPAIEKWTGLCATPEEQKLQTQYAFAVTAMFFELPAPLPMFYHGPGLETLQFRKDVMIEHLRKTKNAYVAMLITSVDFAALEQQDRKWVRSGV